MCRVLVTGGRNYSNYAAVDRVLRALCPSVIIHGGARGADSLCGHWARVNGVAEIACPADWNTHGKRAGFLRNATMLDHAPDCVVSFPGGNGTAHMVATARNKGFRLLPVLE